MALIPRREHYLAEAAERCREALKYLEDPVTRPTFVEWDQLLPYVRAAVRGTDRGKQMVAGVLEDGAMNPYKEVLEALANLATTGEVDVLCPDMIVTVEGFVHFWKPMRAAPAWLREAVRSLEQSLGRDQAPESVDASAGQVAEAPAQAAACARAVPNCKVVTGRGLGASAPNLGGPDGAAVDAAPTDPTTGALVPTVAPARAVQGCKAASKARSAARAAWGALSTRGKQSVRDVRAYNSQLLAAAKSGRVLRGAEQVNAEGRASAKEAGAAEARRADEQRARCTRAKKGMAVDPAASPPPPPPWPVSSSLSFRRITPPPPARATPPVSPPPAALQPTRGSALIKKPMDQQGVAPTHGGHMVSMGACPAARTAAATEGGKVMSPGKADVGETLTLAAGTPQEGAQWIKSIQSAAVFFTEATVKRRREQKGEVADSMQLQAEASALLVRSMDEAKQRCGQEDDQDMRKPMLRAMLLSSDMYGQQLQWTAEGHMSRQQWGLGYASYKLAVGFYLKATAIADELDQHPKFVDVSTMARIKSSMNLAGNAAEMCLLNSQIEHGEETTVGDVSNQAAATAGGAQKVLVAPLVFRGCDDVPTTEVQNQRTSVASAATSPVTLEMCGLGAEGPLCPVVAAADADGWAGGGAGYCAGARTDAPFAAWASLKLSAPIKEKSTCVDSFSRMGGVHRHSYSAAEARRDD